MTNLWQITYPGARPIEMDPQVDTIHLGETGRGRQLAVIPIVGDGPSVRPRTTHEGTVLVRGAWENPPCIAVINTVGEYGKGRLYNIKDASGVCELAKGYLAYGIAGRCGGGPEILAIIKEAATFNLQSKYASYWYSWSGGWVLQTPEERAADLARIAVERGKGEWL